VTACAWAALLMSLGCGRTSTRQSLELTLTRHGAPAAGVEVALYSSASLAADANCHGAPARLIDPDQALVTDDQGKIVIRREVYTRSGGGKFRKDRSAYFTLCARGEERDRVLTRSLGPITHRHLVVTCNLELPPPSREYPRGACTQYSTPQLDETLWVINGCLGILLIARLVFGRTVTDRIAVGVGFGVAGCVLAESLHSYPIASQIYSVFLLVGLLGLHFAWTFSKKPAPGS
jgi:hypothetical protein